MSNIKVKVSKNDIIVAKFTKTLTTIEGYLKEAEGDVPFDNVTYTPKGVVKRILHIKQAMIDDMRKLANEIEEV